MGHVRTVPLIVNFGVCGTEWLFSRLRRFSLRERASVIHWTGACLGPEPAWTLWKRDKYVSCSCWELNYVFSDVQHVTSRCAKWALQYSKNRETDCRHKKSEFVQLVKKRKANCGLSLLMLALYLHFMCSREHLVVSINSWYFGLFCMEYVNPSKGVFLQPFFKF
jgi:hypothetical protein